MLTGLVNKDVTLNVKSSTPIVHKKVLEGNPGATNTRNYVDATDYNIGDTVPFMITGTISSQIKSYDKYTYYFTDTLPKGLTLDKDSIVVQAENVTSGYAKGINAADATKLKASDYTTTVTDNGDGSTTFKVEINDLKSLVKAGTVKTSDTIVVTYNAKLNKEAVIGQAGNTNNVKLTYSNNPYHDQTGTTTNRNAKVYTYELVVNKTGNDNKPLTGAGFTLQKKVDGNYKPIATINPDKKTDDNSNIVAKVVDGTKFEFSGLDQGDYRIVESTVPKGYKKAADIDFTINATFDKQNSSDAALKTLSVTNAPDGQDFSTDPASGVIETTVNNKSDTGFVLPSTGGMGRYIFLAVGALIVLAAIVVPSLKKKKLEN